MMARLLFLIAFLAISTKDLPALMTLSEKRESLLRAHSQEEGDTPVGLTELNLLLLEKKQALHDLYLARENDPQALDEAALQARLEALQKLRREIEDLETTWKKRAGDSMPQEHEALWHQPDTTIGQLVIDYGCYNHLYLIPPEIADMKIHVSSQLSIPKASWDELLELILSHYGIGIKQLNVFARELYFLRINQSGFSLITETREDLDFMHPEKRVCFVLSPPPSEIRRVFVFLERLSPIEQMNVQQIGAHVVLVGLAREVQELLKVYDFVLQSQHLQEYRLIMLAKGQSEEIAKLLACAFEHEVNAEMDVPPGGGGPGPSPSSGGGLRVIPLKHPTQSLFLQGRREQIDKACQLIQDIEDRIGEVQEKIVYFYACKHSEADELADVLNRVYTKILSSPEAFQVKDKRSREQKRKEIDPSPPPVDSSSQGGKLIINVPTVAQGMESSGSESKKKAGTNYENFIVDTKTNSIVMVVEAYVLPKLRELVRKLDVPKRMVQIDILLFEKKVSDNSSFGLNLLRLGQVAARHSLSGMLWNGPRAHRPHRHHPDHGFQHEFEEHDGDNKGILQFLFGGRSGSGFPSHDIAYNFLLTQENIQINANPTVTTVNQTTTKIAVVDQISINTGVVEIDTTKTTRFKDSYTREEYGITIFVTPTIHAKVDDEEDPHAQKYVTLSTDIVFDTTRPNKDNRPDVTRRNIKNEVRVADGQTVILGGLRRKLASEGQESIPFLGEIPGVGKLFSTTVTHDSSSEMFIFLTPRIIPEPEELFCEERRRELLRRPGDIPEFLQAVIEAKGVVKRRLFERGLSMLFGSFPEN